MKLLHFNKKPTFEQHDNEDINYYQFSSSKIKLEREFEEKLKVDICIVGGGLTGISSAVYLAKKGFQSIKLTSDATCTGLTNLPLDILRALILEKNPTTDPLW